MASSIFIQPFGGTVQGDIIITGQGLFADGSAGAPSVSFSTAPGNGMWLPSTSSVGFSTAGTERVRVISTGLNFPSTGSVIWSSGAFGSAGDSSLVLDASNTIGLKNGTSAQTLRLYGYTSGARSTFESIACVTTAVSVSGASTGTGNVIPAGATVIDVATSTTTAITGASGYTVGDGSDVDRWGDITGTAIGTNSGSTNYTADPRWWTAAARAITLTAKTSNFLTGVVQVTVFYRSATAA